MRPFQHPPVEDLDLARVLHALGDSTRLTIVHKLADTGTQNCGSLCCQTPRSTLTHHLRILREAGIIRTTKSGQTHHNELRQEDLNKRFPGLLKTLLSQSA
jgi:DNA-binding transcriptional ArsR family regulator